MSPTYELLQLARVVICPSEKLDPKKVEALPKERNYRERERERERERFELGRERERACLREVDIARLRGKEIGGEGDKPRER